LSQFRTFCRLAVQTQMLPILESGEETLVGGQAVMEGVMMRAPHSYCVAVRKANGEMVTEEQEIKKVSEKYPIFKYPILRGLGTLGQAMSLGMKALQFSTNAALDDEAQKNGEKPVQLSNWMMAGNIALSLGFFIFLYKLVPLLIVEQIGKYQPALSGTVASNFIDGIIRICLFLTFLFVLSRMKDIRRMFEYHGAEHKVVFNFEARTPVTIENAQRFVTFHPRCGTSFLLVVMVISMLVYMALPFQSFGAKFASRIVFLPLISGISYELIRFAAKRRGSLLSLLTAPGLWLQRITTQEPSNEQTAVAIHALEGAMKLEEKQGGELVIA